MLNTISQLGIKLIQGVTFVLLIILSYMCISCIPTSIDYDRRREYYFAIIVAVFVLIVAMIIINKVMHNVKMYSRTRSFVILFIFIFLIQLTLFIAIKPLPVWDSLSTIEEALRMAENGFHMSAQNGYFERYGNNYPFTILFAFIYKVLDILNIDNYWFVSVLLNTMLIDAAYVIGTYLIYKIYNGYKAFLFALIVLLNPFTYVFCWYVYTGTFSCFFIMVELLYVYKIYNDLKSGKVRYKNIILFSVFTAIGTLIRITACFPLIAVAVYLIITRCKKHRELFNKSTIMCCTAFVIITIIIFGSYKLIENRVVDEKIAEQNFPITHWMAMGLNIETNGSFSDEDEAYTDSFKGKEAKKKATSELLQTRIMEMADSDFISIYKRKLSYTWSKPALAMDGYLQSNQNMTGLYKFIAGGKSAPFAAYFQILMAAIYLCAGFTALKLLRAKGSNVFLNIMLITVFGAIIFHLIWESSKVYCIGFIPLVTMLAVNVKDECLGKIELAGPENIKITAIVLLLLEIFIVFPGDTYKSVNVDNYSVYDQPRRHDLEECVIDTSFENHILEGFFQIRHNMKANCISFVVEYLGGSDCKYSFRLYNNEDKLVYSTYIEAKKPDADDLEPLSDTYYYDIKLDEALGPGEYHFSIDPVNANENDSLAFYYCWRRLDEDYNPIGNVIIDRKEYKDLEWVFNVRYQ